MGRQDMMAQAGGDTGLPADWDCDYCNLQADINNAEVNQVISSEQAWYLRERYLRMELE